MNEKKNGVNMGNSLEKVYNFLKLSEKELLEMPIEEVKDDLKSQGVNVEESVKKIKNAIMFAEGKEKLEEARQRRKEIEEKILELYSSFRQLYSETSSDTVDRNVLINRLKVEFSMDEKQATVCYRRFTDYKNDDIQSLFEDMELIKCLEK